MNYTKAAEELHITQPGVSQHIKALERQYDAVLFRRDGKRLMLTPEGALLQRTMMIMQSDEEMLYQKMQSLTAGKQLSFGVTKTIGDYVIADALAEYVKAHPDTNVIMYFGNTSRLKQALIQGQISFAIIAGDFDPESFDYIKLYTQRFIAVCSSAHDFGKPVQCLRDLLAETLLLREDGSGSRRILEKLLDVSGLTIRDFARTVVIGNIPSIVSLVLRDSGITFLYESVVADLLAKGKLMVIPLSGFSAQHDFNFIWNKNSAFADEIREVCLELKSKLVENT